MKWKVDLTAVGKSLERFPLTREEVGSKHQQFEKEITLDQYAKLVPIGATLAPVVEKIRNVEVYKPEVIESVLTPMEMTQFYDAISQLDQALNQVSFDTLRVRQNPDGDIKNTLLNSDKITPTVDHWARTLAQRVTMQAQARQQSAPTIDTSEAKAVIENLKKETDMAVEAHAKRVQMELADDQIAEITACIKRHKDMSYRCLLFLVATALFAARLVVWISADGDKLGIWFGPVFHAITTEISSGAAFYFGVGKLAVISFAFGLVISVGRLYQTYCHNLVMNEQRMIAFRAFKKMLASVPDAGPREKLVTAAANAIFEHGSSGFLPKGTNEFTPLDPPLWLMQTPAVLNACELILHGSTWTTDAVNKAIERGNLTRRGSNNPIKEVRSASQGSKRFTLVLKGKEFNRLQGKKVDVSFVRPLVHFADSEVVLKAIEFEEKCQELIGISVTAGESRQNTRMLGPCWTRNFITRRSSH